MRAPGSQWHGWFPGAVDHRGAAGELIWRNLGRSRLLEPFFEQSFRKSIGPERRSGWEKLAEVASISGSVAPTGFVFHMSRCGSTLVGRMLAALPSTIVLSEAPSIDAVLRADAWESDVDAETQIERFQQLVAVLGQRRFDEERYLFIKFDAWSIAQLPLIHRAFPQVPWIFLYRDPVEVLVSHRTRPGMHMVPGLLQGAPFSNAPDGLEHDDYGPWLLAQVCGGALHHRHLGRGMLVDYTRLPEYVTTQLPGHFGIALSDEERRQMEAVLPYNAKAPGLTFESDSAHKQAAATPQLRALAERWLGASWRALRDAR